MLKKVKFFNKKWKVVGRMFKISFGFASQIKKVFLHENLAQLTRSLSFEHFLKDFFLLLELGTKSIFDLKQGWCHKW